VARVTLTSRFPEIARALPGGAARETHAAAERVADSMRRRVPVRTGAHRDSIRVQRGGLGDDAVARVVMLDTWPFLEFGTVDTAARPFVYPATEAEQARLVGGVRRLFD
jgi:HK97 gp10 family phage protein